MQTCGKAVTMKLVSFGNYRFLVYNELSALTDSTRNDFEFKTPAQIFAINTCKPQCLLSFISWKLSFCKRTSSKIELCH